MPLGLGLGTHASGFEAWGSGSVDGGLFSLWSERGREAKEKERIRCMNNDQDSPKRCSSRDISVKEWSDWDVRLLLGIYGTCVCTSRLARKQEVICRKGEGRTHHTLPSQRLRCAMRGHSPSRCLSYSEEPSLPAGVERRGSDVGVWKIWVGVLGGEFLWV